MNLDICLSDNANFSKIANKLKIGKLLQKGYIEVNEEGTETVIISSIFTKFYTCDDMDIIRSLIMDCDRPFLFLISPDIENIPKDYFLIASVVNEFKNCQPRLIYEEVITIYMGIKKLVKLF